MEPGASIGPHSHHGEEDFYYCISGSGIVVDNGVEHTFTPGTLQITRDGETQAIRNTGETELVFLGALVANQKYRRTSVGVYTPLRGYSFSLIGCY